MLPLQEAQLSQRDRAVTVKTVLDVAKMFVELHLISPALGERPSRSSKVIKMTQIDMPYDTSY